MAQVSRANHTVPQFYLRGFAKQVRDKALVGVVRRPGKVRYLQNVAKVSVINDFYTVNGAPQLDVIEKLIADEFEAPAAEVFRQVLIDRVWPLSEEDRTILSSFLALQHARGAHKRQALNEIAGTIASGLEDGSGFDTAASDWPDKLKAAHIKSMLNFEETGARFFLRPWTLVRFVRKRLLSCDAPISLRPFPDAPAGSAVGIGTAGMILFPMSRTTGLVMSGRLIETENEAREIASGQFDSVAAGSTAAANDLNNATIQNARNSIYHHPEDAALVPQHLEEPQAQEVLTDDPFPGEEDREDG